MCDWCHKHARKHIHPHWRHQAHCVSRFWTRPTQHRLMAIIVVVRRTLKPGDRKRKPTKDWRKRSSAAPKVMPFGLIETRPFQLLSPWTFLPDLKYRMRIRLARQRNMLSRLSGREAGPDQARSAFCANLYPQSLRHQLAFLTLPSQRRTSLRYKEHMQRQQLLPHLDKPKSSKGAQRLEMGTRRHLDTRKVPT